jgi:hypothetical protein
MSKARDLASAAPAPAGVTSTELGYVDGVTSAIQTQLDAKTAKDTLTTTGDIYYASAANTPARLGIGTASQLLAVNSGATAPEWVAAPSSGGMTLISTTTLSGASTTISSISQDYRNLHIIVRNVDNAGTTVMYLGLRLNGDSGSNYANLNGADYETRNSNFGVTEWSLISEGSDSVLENLSLINIYDYTNTTTRKLGDIFTICNNDGTSTNAGISRGYNAFRTTSAITSLTFVPIVSTFTGGTVLVYGVK